MKKLTNTKCAMFVARLHCYPRYETIADADRRMLLESRQLDPTILQLHEVKGHNCPHVLSAISMLGRRELCP